MGLLLTLAAERVAPRVGAVAGPAADRWHRAPVSLLGGVAIVVATLGPLLAPTPPGRNLILLAITAFAMAGVGLIDDVRSLSPQAKLLAGASTTPGLDS